MKDIKRKIYDDVLTLYDLAHENGLDEVCEELSNAEHVLWEMLKHDDNEKNGGSNGINF